MESLSAFLSFVAILAFLLALAAAGVYLYKTAYPEKSMRFLKPKLHRLEFIERAHLDGGRKLLLVRRDDVEHLLLIGGPIDLVVETGIRPGLISSGDYSADESLETGAQGLETASAIGAREFTLASRLDAAPSLRSEPDVKDFRGEFPEPKLSMASKKDKVEDAGPGLNAVAEEKTVS